jgi:exopolyphosphatase / guanosine-5'-triphosphate,3'-diphosphate pyrophosphatase
MNRRRLAVIDIGTNTILCVIAELTDEGHLRVLEDLAEITRLGAGVDRTGRINSEGEQRSLEVLRGYVARCRELGVEEIVAGGTSALRDAKNSSEVTARFKRELEIGVRVLSGEEEAAYSYLAVERGLNLGSQELLVIDIGGGSTEFIWGRANGVYRLKSLDVGSVRLTERFLRSDPVRDDECDEMIRAIDSAIKPLVDPWGSPDGLRLVGIAGTFTTLAAVEKQLTCYSHNDVHGSSLSLGEVRRQIRLYREKTVAERKKVAGLEPKRADVILAGAYLIDRIMSLFHVDTMIVSDQGVRYGLLHERMDQLRKG